MALHQHQIPTPPLPGSLGINPPPPVIVDPIETDPQPFQLQGFNTGQDRLQNILGLLGNRSRFDSFFSGLSQQGGNTVFGRNDLQSLLDTGLLNNDGEGRLGFLRGLLGNGQGSGGGGPIRPGGHGIGGGSGGGGRGRSTTGNSNSNSSFIPDDVQQAMIDRILAMLENPGIPTDTLDAQRRSIHEQGSIRERQRLLLAGDQSAGRGIFGSGVANRDLERIMQDESTGRRQQNSQLDFTNAMQALQSIQTAQAGGLGLGQLNLGERGLEVQEAISRAQIAAQRSIAGGQLGLGYANLNQGNDQFAAQLALQQYLLSLQYGGSFGGGAAAPALGGGGAGGGAGFSFPNAGQGTGPPGLPRPF